MDSLNKDLSKHDWLKRIFTLRKDEEKSKIFKTNLKNHNKNKRLMIEKKFKKKKKKKKYKKPME